MYSISILTQLFSNKSHLFQFGMELDKGDYTILVELRHANEVLLNKYRNLSLIAKQKLPSAITMEPYLTQSDVLTLEKKFGKGFLKAGQMIPCFFGTIPDSK